jgi:hypothetical protein
LPVYTFRFFNESVIQMGVMAQDVREVIPEAVHEDENGLLMVDYAMIR